MDPATANEGCFGQPIDRLAAAGDSAGKNETCDAVAILCSGGVDSAVLVADLARSSRVHPIYVRFRLSWEDAEIASLERYLADLADPSVAPLEVLAMPVAEIYGGHWSLTGVAVPDASTADDAVYLPGRNLLLLAKTAIWCQRQQINRIALGTLAGNPFADASDAFFDQYEALLKTALGWSPRIERPYRHFQKVEVLRRASAWNLPLEWSFSCIAPVDGLHCGRCNKCEERRQAFILADIQDRTKYAYIPETSSKNHSVANDSVVSERIERYQTD